MSNPRTQYNEYVRANLPSGMTFDSDLARYRYNDHSFASFWVANIYYKYIQKFGGGLPPLVLTNVPDTQNLTAGTLVSSISGFAVTDTTPTADTAVLRVNGAVEAGGYALQTGDSVTVRYEKAGYSSRTTTIDTFVAGVPDQIIDLAVSSSADNELTYSFSAPADNDSATTSYELEVDGNIVDIGLATSGTLINQPSGTYDVRVRAKNALGDGAWSAADQVTVNQSTIYFSVGEVDGEPVVTYGAAGAISVTLASPAEYVGTYTTDYLGTPLTTSLVESGAVCLVRPTTTSNTGVGETQTATQGLYIFAGDEPADPQGNWQRDGVDITDAVLLDYVIANADAGTDLSYAETFDGVTISTVPISIPNVSLATDTGAIVWYDPDTITVNGSNEVTNWPNSAANGASDWDLDTVPSSGPSAPTWDAVNKKAEFAGAECICTGSTAGTPFVDELITNSGTLTILYVAEQKNVAGFMSSFGFADLSGATSSSSFYVGHRTGGNMRVEHYNTNTVIHSSGGYSPDNGTVYGKQLFKIVLTRTTIEVYGDGLLMYSNTNDLNAGIFAQDPFSFALGGVANATDHARLSHVDFYEFFITTSTGSVAALEAELNTKHGL